MDFKEATDRLTDRVTHEELAGQLGVSVASIRQARLSEGAAARRAPPSDWQRAVLRLARERIRHFQRLVEELERAAGEGEP